uniref:Integrase family protein n=1 Tax=Rhodopseudomonas palustris (strain DX-1) TaxID=652103 RepID=E6VL19_RHOPX
MPVDKRYLWKRGGTYSAVFDVPKAVQAALGTKRFVKALGTSSLSEANRLKLPLVMEWKRRVAQAHKSATDPLAGLWKAALEWRQAVLAADTGREHEEDEYGGSNHVEVLEAIDEEVDRVLLKHPPAVAEQFKAVATGKATFIQETYELWLNQFEGTEQTRSQHEAAVKRFLVWAKSTETIEAVTRKRAGEYVNALLEEGHLSRRTIQRHCSSLSSLWMWFRARGYTEQENPWRGHGLSSKKGKAPYRRAYDDETILKLLQADYGERYKDTIPDLIRLALLSGARLEVFCSLKKAGIEKREDGYWATIEGDKTEAGNRTVPLHSAASGIIERRLNGSGEYLFEGLEPGGPDRKRSWNVGKMFRHHRQKITTTKGEDFHAFRNTFIACMEGHEVPESTTKLLVGHKRESMTYGHYSKGERVKLREAIEKLDYGPQIMSLISGTHTCN